MEVGEGAVAKGWDICFHHGSFSTHICVAGQEY